MVLSIQNLSVTLSKRKVLEDISLEITAGEVIGLLGPNGAGKSTLMRAAAQLQDYNGTVVVEGRDAATLAANARARLIAYLPQARTIGWRITVRDLVGLGRLPFRAYGIRLNQSDRDAIEMALQLTDTSHLADRIASELSGGEQARVLTARAVAQTTPLLVADEPASGLDPAHQILLMQALRRLADQQRAVLVSLHDLTLAARWCDRIILLDQGHLAAQGRPAEILTRERLASVYGIETHIEDTTSGLILSPTGLVER